jgi:putative transposase
MVAVAALMRPQPLSLEWSKSMTADHNTTLKTYKYRLYPNVTQAARLDFLLWQGRKVYNAALAMRIDHYQTTGETLSWMEIRNELRAQRREQSETWGQLPTESLDDTVRRMHKAFEAFWRRVKEGTEKPGFPRFKDRYHFNSLGFVPVKQPIRVPSDKWAKLYLTNVGDVRLRYHRPLPQDAIVKMIVVKRDTSGKWWAALQTEVEQPAPAPHPGPAVGVDIGLHYALALSDGTVVEQPKWYRDGQRERRVIMRKLDRQRRANNPDCFNADGTAIEGKRPLRKSARMKETEAQLRRLENQIAQQRWYWWHAITDWLTREYSLIALEDLTLDFMLKNKRLAMSAQNASFGMFWQQLDYKAQERSVEIVRVNPAYTSQTCAECGAVSADNRTTQARFECVACGHVDNADLNAAKNILRVAVRGRAEVPVGETKAIRSRVPYKVHHDPAVAQIGSP